MRIFFPVIYFISWYKPIHIVAEQHLCRSTWLALINSSIGKSIDITLYSGECLSWFMYYFSVFKIPFTLMSVVLLYIATACAVIYIFLCLLPFRTTHKSLDISIIFNLSFKHLENVFLYYICKVKYKNKLCFENIIRISCCTFVLKLI